MHIGRIRSVSGLGALSAVCVTGTVLAITLLAAVPAQAGQVKFFGGDIGYVAPNGISTTVYDAIKNDTISCPSGDCNGGLDVLTSAPFSQSFTVGLITITATAPTGGGLWFDQDPAFGGLGVGLASQGSNADQIEAGDTLRLTFSSPVALTGIATLFVDPHKPFGLPGFPEESDVFGTNKFQINGNDVFFGTANAGSFLLTDFVGTQFDFTVAAGTQPSFYISGLTWEGVEKCDGCGGTTPIPGAVWLFGGGLGLVAMLSGRRKRKQKSVWEVTQNA